MSANAVQVAELIRVETGISIKAAQLASLEAALRRVDPTISVADVLLANTDSVDRNALLEQVIDEVSIKETFYFRQRAELEAIDWRRLVQTARASGSEHARVWVAACATGEEAYTLAILASQAFDPGPPPVSIHATDISVSALAYARDGRYGRRSTRGLDESVVRRYFQSEGAQLVVGGQLRGLVEFSRQNLVRDAMPAGGGPFDLIACRNVLIYFEPDTVERVVAALTQALSPHGTLLLGAADRLCCSANKLLRMHDAKASSQHGAKNPQPAHALRRPLGREDPDTLPLPAASIPAAELDEALRAGDTGDLQLALEVTARVLEDDPLDSNAYFIRGLAHRGLGRDEEAVRAFRSALYVDPGFGLAAFEMGRAHEACGDTTAAARAYRQALRVLDPMSRNDPLHARVDVGDVAAACAIRLHALSAASTRMRRTAPIGIGTG
jgi:chemotaxis methyl-accepting protein methylase